MSGALSATEISYGLTANAGALAGKRVNTLRYENTNFTDGALPSGFFESPNPVLPFTSWSACINLAHGNNADSYNFRFVMPFFEPNKIFYRSMNGFAADWVEMAHTDNLAGAWQPMTLLNGWTDYGMPWSVGIRARKSLDGRVTLDGTLLSPVVANIHQPIFVLPTDLRPLHHNIVSVRVAGGTATMDIYSNGTIAISTESPILAGNYVSLAGVSFYVD